jgi:hypothetical protein
MARSATPQRHPQHYEGLLLACVCQRGRLHARGEDGDELPILYVVPDSGTLDDPLAQTVEDFRYRNGPDE